jgi:DNA (cytosine-5)-methyltransferase 1
MKYFSTFTGIGGFEVGIHRAFEATQERIRQESQEDVRVGTSGGTDEGYAELDDRTAELFQHAIDSGAGQPHCVGYSEIDKYASSVYERHYPNVRNYGDITKINADELPDFDLLVGGFPCQAFSIAGKRRGFEDTRGTLFFDLARILKAKTPRLFVFENVKGLLSHDGGATFKTIIAATSELGYDCQWQVLNSKNHGVPQNRERIIIVGHLRGTPRPEVFPIAAGNGDHLKEITHSVPQAQRVYDETGISPSLDTAGGGNRQPKVVIAAQRGRYNSEGVIEQQLEPRFDGLSNTLTAVQKDNMLYEPMIRRLTPIECERLQAFPDNWTKYGKDNEPISDTQRYKMCGNAVTTNVIRDVMEKILK